MDRVECETCRAIVPYVDASPDGDGPYGEAIAYYCSKCVHRAKSAHIAKIAILFDEMHDTVLLGSRPGSLDFDGERFRALRDEINAHRRMG